MWAHRLLRDLDALDGHVRLVQFRPRGDGTVNLNVLAVVVAQVDPRDRGHVVDDVAAVVLKRVDLLAIDVNLLQLLEITGVAPLAARRRTVRAVGNRRCFAATFRPWAGGTVLTVFHSLI